MILCDFESLHLISFLAYCIHYIFISQVSFLAIYLLYPVIQIPVTFKNTFCILFVMRCWLWLWVTVQSSLGSSLEVTVFNLEIKCLNYRKSHVCVAQVLVLIGNTVMKWTEATATDLNIFPKSLPFFFSSFLLFFFLFPFLPFYLLCHVVQILVIVSKDTVSSLKFTLIILFLTEITSNKSKPWLFI